MGVVGEHMSGFGRGSKTVAVHGDARSLCFLKLNHVNAIVDGYDGAVAHFVGRLGFQLNMEVRADPAEAASPYGGSDACLVTLGGVIFELFAPQARSERGQGRLLSLYGDHYIGVEYQVGDVAQAREICRSLGIRILSDAGEYFFTHPADGFGISFELYDRDWHGTDPPFPEFAPVRPSSYWRNEHPLGVTGLDCIRVAVHDLDAAAAFFATALGAQVGRREERPQLGAVAASLVLADTTVELLAPTGRGEIERFLDRYGQRIRSTVFRVRNLHDAERHLASLGIALAAGDDQRSRLLDPERNHGLRFELATEARVP